MSRTQVRHPYVTSARGIQGGSPTVEGTRIPVATIVIWHKQGKDIDEILQMYPQLNPAQIYDVLSYYHDNQEAVEKEVALLQDEEAWKNKYPSGKGTPRN
jgi:uncharacterized protein (DUF433 family)